MPDDTYANIREILSDFIGTKLVEVTQHDEDEFKETGLSYIALHFDNGKTMTFYTDGSGPEFLVVEDLADDDGD